jgi:hypothetical protein
MNNDQSIEQEIQAKGKTAPRITPADIEANIAQEHYFTAADGCHCVYQGGPEFQACDKSLDLLTFCVLVLRNGFTVTGESACASPENFDAEIGRKVARANAVQKIWPLMGYELKSKLANQVGQGKSTTASALPPHQQRVLDEKQDLDIKASALSQFIGNNPIFNTLDAAEQERFKEQNDLMWQYSEILGARINAFNLTGAA